MGSDAKKAYGAEGRDELLLFDPENLTIVDDPDHPLNDPDRLREGPSERFINNIRVHGVKMPIMVRLNGKGRNDKPIVEVVAGRQRTLALRIVNKERKKQGLDLFRISAKRMRGEDHEMLATMVIENEFRRDDTPLAKARKAKRYMDMGRTLEETGELFGVGKSTVHGWLALLECSAPVQKAIEEGKIPATTAVTLGRLPKAEQKPALDKMLAEGTVKGKSGAVAAARLSSPERAEKISKVPTRYALKELREDLIKEKEFARESASELALRNAVIATLDYALEGKEPEDKALAAFIGAPLKDKAKGSTETLTKIKKGKGTRAAPSKKQRASAEA